MSLTDYLPAVVMGALVLVFGLASMVGSALLRPHRPNPIKLSAYECGNDPVRLPRGERFSVKFYVVAMLFIIFDIETIFLFPWAVSFRSLGLFGLVEMTIFIGLVFVAYFYVWRKGGLDWSEPATGVRSLRAIAGGLGSDPGGPDGLTAEDLLALEGPDDPGWDPAWDREPEVAGAR